MCHGDPLYHDGLYRSAIQSNGSYDFSENFTYVKAWFDQADLVIGDFEGTISLDKPLASYPLYPYHTWILDDFIRGGKEGQHIDLATQERINRAYQEMTQHVHLNWPQGN
ncbi:Capsule biosynthesis protein capA [Streptococcus sp. DD12]|nr:Capsule biosynthesis protein capA [Streptococcus sp. DD12]